MLLSTIPLSGTYWVIKEAGVDRIKEKLMPIRLYAVQHELFAQRRCMIYEGRGNQVKWRLTLVGKNLRNKNCLLQAHLSLKPVKSRRLCSNTYSPSESTFVWPGFERVTKWEEISAIYSEVYLFFVSLSRYWLLFVPFFSAYPSSCVLF